MGTSVRFFDFLWYVVNKYKERVIRRKSILGEEEEAPSDLNWPHQLPQDILNLILQRLAAGDHIRLGAVCTSLRAAVARAEVSPRLEFPLILYSATNPSKNDHLFSRLGKNKLYSINPVHTKGKRICGSFEGRWLIMVGCNNAETTPFFLNLMTGDKIMLPAQPQPTVSRTHVADADPCFFKIIVASSEPTNSDCLVAAITEPISKRYRLVFCRLTDTKWTTLDKDDTLNDLTFEFIVFCDGKLYATTPNVRYLVVFDLRYEVYKAQKLVIEVPRPLPHSLLARKKGSLYYFSLDSYLFVSDSVTRELFLIYTDADYVSMEHPKPGHMSNMIIHSEKTGFRVWKMDMDHNIWIEINDIGDRILFTGDYESFFIPVESLGESIQGNCIYYSFGSDVDMGRFCLTDKTRVRHSKPIFFGKRNPCVWFVPTIYKKNVTS